MVQAEVIEYLDAFIRNDSKGLAVLLKTNMSSRNLTLMQGFTNNAIKNVIIVSSVHLFLILLISDKQRTGGYVLGTNFGVDQLTPSCIMMSFMSCIIQKCQALLID